MLAIRNCKTIRINFSAKDTKSPSSSIFGPLKNTPVSSGSSWGGYQRNVFTLKDPKEQWNIIEPWTKRSSLLANDETVLASVPPVVKRTSKVTGAQGEVLPEYYFAKPKDEFAFRHGPLDRLSDPEPFWVGRGQGKTEFSLRRQLCFVKTPAIILADDMPESAKERVALGVVTNMCELRPRGADVKEPPLRRWLGSPLSFFMTSSHGTNSGVQTFLTIPVKSERELSPELQKKWRKRANYSIQNAKSGIPFWGDGMAFSPDELVGTVGVSTLKTPSPDRSLVLPTARIELPETAPFVAQPLITSFVGSLNRFMTQAFSEKRPIVGLEEEPLPTTEQITEFNRR